MKFVDRLNFRPSRFYRWQAIKCQLCLFSVLSVMFIMSVFPVLTAYGSFFTLILLIPHTLFIPLIPLISFCPAVGTEKFFESCSYQKFPLLHD